VRAPRASKLIGQPAPAEPAQVVELIDAGREPRRRLRYSAGPGTRQRVHLRGSLSSDTQLAGRRATAIPPQGSEAWFIVSVVAAQADRLECEIRFERATTIDLQQYATAGVGQERTLDRLPGHAFRFSMDRRGFVQRPPLQLPPGLDVDRDRDLVWELLEGSLRAIVALPLEPVGPGARWRTLADDRGPLYISARVSTDVELVAVRGQRLELKQARAYAVPPEHSFIDIQLLGFSRSQSEGGGQAVLDLSLVHPIEAQGRTEVRQEGVLLVLSEQIPMRAVSTETLSIGAR
jgi:hypothetical protein